jgi:Protein of unknown function (DUF3667)
MRHADGTRCANCGVALAGLYCHACGQRHEPDVLSIGHWAREAVESLTHADSRLWRTLLALLFRPGHLTREFFDGRRARYLPPIRLYLVISVLFFVVAAMLPGGGSIRFGLDDTVGERLGVTAGAATDDRCAERVRYAGPGQDWLRPRLVESCRKLERDGLQALNSAFIHNLPRALFVLLPLIAAVMQLLYWRPRHHYVEHLLFLLHNHACVFLVGTLLLVLGYLLPGAGVAAVAALAYFAWYFHRALRVAYGQSRRRSLVKLLVLGVVYGSIGGTAVVATLGYSLVTL